MEERDRGMDSRRDKERGLDGRREKWKEGEKGWRKKRRCRRAREERRQSVAVADTAVNERTATKRGISVASREGPGTDGLRGFERNHGNLASPGRLPSDWLFLAFPPIPWILARVSPRRAAQHRRRRRRRRRCPIIIYGAAHRDRNPESHAAMAEAHQRRTLPPSRVPSNGQRVTFWSWVFFLGSPIFI